MKTFKDVEEMKNVKNARFGLLSVILNDNTRASNDLTGNTLTVNLAQASPLSKELRVRDLEQTATSNSTTKKEKKVSSSSLGILTPLVGRENEP